MNHRDSDRSGVTSQKLVIAARRPPHETDEAFDERIAELVLLCEAAGGNVVAQFTQARQTVDRAVYMGTGKVQEMADYVEADEIELVVFDAELSPAQIRNLEALLPCRVIDRTQLILDIFAQRARSREGMLQVEIAQLQYMLPRLTGRGVALSRLGGGIGTRGPGETKLEMDRRRIRERIRNLQARLKNMEGRRTVQRNRRSRSTPSVGIVGYTNAGKTTLLQRWTADRGLSPQAAGGENRLFDTLDPLARRVKSGATGELVVLDTVGFVQNLPHLLVDAFRATLEEVTAVDLIVHVVDGSHNNLERMETTYAVLKALSALDRPIITFFNKADIAEDMHPMPDVHAVASIWGSAKTGLGMDKLYEKVDEVLGMDTVLLSVSGTTRVEDALWHQLGRLGRVASVENPGGDGVSVKLAVERRVADRTRAQLLAQHPDLHIEMDTQEGHPY